MERERYLFNQPNLEEFKFHLNRLNILNRFKTEFEPRRPALCRPGPPRLPLSLPHPAADHRTPLPPGPICQSRSAASPANRRSPLSAQQRRRSCLTTEGRCRPRLSPRAVDRHAPSSPYLSYFLSSAWHTRADPPPFPSLVLPRAPADLEKPLAPHSASFRARARTPLLLHSLCVHLTSSRHWRSLLLSGSCPGTAVVCDYR
jgi:hypothetical protein